MRTVFVYGFGFALGVGAAALNGCTSLRETAEEDALGGHAYRVLEASEGTASYYSDRLHGRRTASGERYNRSRFTAAHNSYPFGTWLRVTAKRTGKSVLVRVNDRGPIRGNRIVDLSYAAARELGMLRSGVIPVRVEVIDWGGEEGTARN
ncbi:MAG: septal ring lytic transglycosylase RlpA family protein [Bacteroidota bacterium]|nr:septal ring lytic transglycosylase RlpA family protein [Bacteroidota bacterium]